MVLLFPEFPMLKRPAAARAAGFSDVEFWWPFDAPIPDDRAVERFVDAVGAAGVNVVGLNLYDGDRELGDRGILSHPHCTQLFRDNLEVALSVGSRVGCKNYNALYGRRIPDVAIGHQDEIATENLRYARDAAAKVGGRILIEPLSAIPGFPIRTCADAATVVRRVGGIYVLFDIYHLTVNGDDVAKGLANHSDIIGHVQVADSPGRHEPGTGSIPFATLLPQLDATGYDGLVSLEYIPSRGTVESFGWLEQLHAADDRFASHPPATGPNE